MRMIKVISENVQITRLKEKKTYLNFNFIVSIHILGIWNSRSKFCLIYKAIENGFP